ncbi:MAG: hypothetical protein ACPGR7_05625 [Flavobacteriaceae bacterium]
MILLCLQINSKANSQEIIPPVPTGFGPQAIQPIEGEALASSASYTEGDCTDANKDSECALLVYCCSLTKPNGKPLYNNLCQAIDGTGSGACETYPLPLWTQITLLFSLIFLFLQFYFETLSFKVFLLKKQLKQYSV